LGNSRITFTSQEQVDTYTATMEIDTQTEEANIFGNYHPMTNNLLDHTDTGLAYDKVTLLNGGYTSGSYNGQVGLTKSLKVVPGDVISASVYAKYIDLSGPASNLANFATALTEAFALSPGMPGEAATAYQALNAFGSILATGDRDVDDDDAPRGFINILVFDEDYNFVDFTFAQIDADYVQDGGPVVSYDPLVAEMTIRKPGFVYIYVSNEESTELQIGFDDLSLNHTHGRVIQQDEYYPFGLTFNSYTRENSTPNQYKFNGKEEQDELGLNVLDFGWRTYDPTIARFTAVDAFSDKYFSMTPYQYGANNPIKYVDVNGDSLMLFKNGSYVATVDNGKEEITGYNQLSETDDDGNESFTGGYNFGFNDIDEDKTALKSKEMTVELISNDAMESAANGANDARGDENRYSFIFRESRLQHDKSKGKMDFWATSDIMQGDNVLHVARSKAGDAVGYNGSDFGNFMWGMAGRKLGFNLTTLRLGAHYNNVMHGEEDNKWNKKYEHQILDAAADQRAIRNGYNYNRKFQENAVILPKD